MGAQNPSFVAEIDLSPSRIVKHSGTTKSFQVTLAVDGDSPQIGVTHEGSREAPIPGITPLAAKAGESVRIYGPGDVCSVIVGAVALNAGVYVMADAAGKAIVATTGKYAVGRTLGNAGVGEQVQIMVEPIQLN